MAHGAVAKLLALLAGRTVIAVAAITIGLFDPAMDRRSARLKLARQIPYAADSTRQGNKLFPEIKWVMFLVLGMMTRSAHNSDCVHQTEGTPVPA